MMYRRYGIIKLSDFASSIVLIFFLLGIGLFAYGIQLFAEGTIFIADHAVSAYESLF